MSLAPQRNDSAPDLHIRTSRHVIIPRRSELWRSATLIAGPRVSLPLNRQLQTSCLVGLGRSPVRDLIAIMLDVPADSFALDVDVIMPTPVTALLAEAWPASSPNRPNVLGNFSAVKIRQAAAALHNFGVPLRDIGSVAEHLLPACAPAGIRGRGAELPGRG